MRFFFKFLRLLTQKYINKENRGGFTMWQKVIIKISGITNLKVNSVKLKGSDERRVIRRDQWHKCEMTVANKDLFIPCIERRENL